ncbi:hypothetical protein MHC_01625 [Mycoplasma haemocanis str. Illinois]|uniref:Uncharacterized protein n=1 Tax=Mycoplasma haemocanis (strain Illinois) TaxID=1111676 RepID=H6N6B9_MYCHN|nr:hypothetical protein [Mycoplasma haemocanis]AEW45191.1 hypothetical protein MHC_01625 [Mycoplasma haemocanis str. Illinois]
MPKLPIIGSVLVVGGGAGVGGVAMEFSKPKGRNISLAKNKKPSPFKMPTRCEFFWIQDSGKRTVKKIEESRLQREIKEQKTEDLWKRLDSDCSVKWKIYVAKRYVSGSSRMNQWVYEDGDQKHSWTVI